MVLEVMVSYLGSPSREHYVVNDMIIRMIEP